MEQKLYEHVERHTHIHSSFANTIAIFKSHSAVFSSVNHDWNSACYERSIEIL